LFDTDVEYRRRGRAGGVLARTDRRDETNHQARERVPGDLATPKRARSNTGRRCCRAGSRPGAGGADIAAAATAVGAAAASVDGTHRPATERRGHRNLR